MTESLNESTVEEATLEWFGALGYEALRGPEIAPGEPGVLWLGYSGDGLTKPHSMPPGPIARTPGSSRSRVH